MIAGFCDWACAADTVPVIYCTDLFHPHEDPDDHFDLACLYAMEELDVKLIVLDQGRRQQRQPGSVAVRQMNAIAGRNVPFEIGLADALTSPQDTGENQNELYQYGVRRILEILRESSKPVAIITVGSVRDVAAAFNRDPDLFKGKVFRLLIFIGEASDAEFIEYNVGLDVHAFRDVMGSGLPVYWVPCFDGGLWQNQGKASYWKASQSKLLEGVSDRVTNYFIYALMQKKDDPIHYLYSPVDPDEKKKVFRMDRNLWCTAIFGSISNRKIMNWDGKCLSVTSDSHVDGREMKLFGFEEQSITVDSRGRIEVDPDGKINVMRFKIYDPVHYSTIMTHVTRNLLIHLP